MIALSKEGKKTKAKRRDKIDLSGWNLKAVEPVCTALSAIDDLVEQLQEIKKFKKPGWEVGEEMVLKAVAEVLEFATEESVTGFFPAEYDRGDDPSDGDNGPPVKNGAIFRIGIPIGGEECEEPHWDIDLDEVISNMIEWNSEEAAQRKIDGNHYRGIVRVRDALRRLADKLDEALKP